MEEAITSSQTSKSVTLGRPWIRCAFLSLAAAVPLVTPYVTSDFNLYYANLVLIYIILVHGLNISYGFTGIVNMGHIALFCIGAYSSAAIAQQLGVPYLLALPLGAMMAVLVGVVLAIPAVRLPLVGLALVTFTFGDVVSAVIGRIGFLGGYSGLMVRFSSAGPIPLDSNTGRFYLIYPIALILSAACLTLSRSRIGRAFFALADSPVAAQSMGINLNAYRVLAFAISAFFAGIAGGLYGPQVRYLDPLSFTLTETILIYMMIVIGGAGTYIGPMLGVALVIYLPELLRPFDDYRALVYGAILTFFVIFLPEGIWERFLNWRQARAIERRKASGAAGG